MGNQGINFKCGINSTICDKMLVYLKFKKKMHFWDALRIFHHLWVVIGFFFISLKKIASYK